MLSGTAPSIVTISLIKGNLPGQGLVPGAFVGELLFWSTTGSSVTVPVVVTVGPNVFNQVNAISFNKPFGGANPLPQILTIPSTGTNFYYSAVATTATGGSWLAISNNTGCALCTTPGTITASITAGAALAAGTYTGQIVITSQYGTQSMTVPVTLTVGAAAPFFDNVQGQISFSIQTGGGNPPTQPVQIRDAGFGSLNWTVTPTTSDGGTWLTAIGPSGTAPSTVTVGVTVGSLPGQGLVAGTFTGQLLFQTAGASVTIPVSVVVGANVFAQLSELNFTKAFGGANPAAQKLNIASTGTAFYFSSAASTGTGGNWLSIATTGGCVLCLTPNMVTATVTASSTLAAGTYTGQIVAISQTGAMAMTVPVSLTVTSGACSALLGASGALSSFAGGTFSVSVTEGSGCGWNAVSNATSFLTVTSGASGTGNGTVTFSVTQNTGLARQGTLTIAGQTFTVNQGAALLSPLAVTPASGNVATQTFVFTFVDPVGYADLGVQDILINNFLDGAQACYIAFVPSGPTSGSIYLIDDAGDGGGPFAGTFNLGTSGASASNSQCTVKANGSSVSSTGNVMTLTLAVTFTGSFAGNKVIYMASQNQASSASSGWQALGTWDAPGTAPTGPAVGGVNPARSATMGQTYTFTFTDTNGFADLTVVDVLTNNFLDGVAACYVAFAPASATTGYVYLVDDAGDGGYAAGSPITLPSSSTLQNNQCTISATGSSVSASGNTLTLHLAITFNSAFAGNRVFYLSAQGKTANSGWQSVGSVTVP
jgi:hypothetical protein